MSDSAFVHVRRDLRYVRQVQDGAPVYVVKDPVGLKYFRFGETEAWLMQQMDGTRTLAQIAERLRADRGSSATAESLEAFHRRLQELGLAERAREERSVLIMEAMRQQRHDRLLGNGNTLLRMRFSLGDPNQLLDRVIDRIRFFWSPGFVALSVALFLAYALILATHWGAFSQAVAMMYSPASYTVESVLTLYLAFGVIGAIHEFGHGLTCKHFGGEVHEIGAMLLYFSPALYCNVNDAWTLERKAHRLWVTFAGGWTGLLLAALAAFVWVTTQPGTVPHELAVVTMLLGGSVVLILNFNPLIPLDGYYALMDWLDVPNLRARSFEYLRAVARRALLRMDVPLPAVTPRERKIFLVYGPLALLYTSSLMLATALWVAALLIGWLGAWGWALVLFGVWAFGRRRIRAAVRLLRARATGPGMGSRRRRLLARVTALAALAALLAVLVPWDVRVAGPAVIEPTRRAWLRPADAGWVESVQVAEGAAVSEGDTVAVLRDLGLEVAWTRARTSVAALERETAAARGIGETALARAAEMRLDAARTQLAELERRRGALVLRAPFAGRLATPRPAERVGTRAAPGDSLLELWADGPLRVRVRLAERDAGRVGAGSPVGIKFPVRPEWTWRGRVLQVSPAARERHVELLARFAAGASPAEPQLLRPGMVGEAKVVVRETHVAGALLDKLLHTLRMDWLL